MLENHHWRSAVGCLLESGVAEQLLPHRTKLELQIRDLILATDINRQNEFLTKFKVIITQSIPFCYLIPQKNYKRYAKKIGAKANLSVMNVA